MFSSLLTFFWLLIQAFAALSLATPAFFCLIYFIKRNFKKQDAEEDELYEEKDFAIIVSANEPSESLYALLQSLVQLNYTNYLVYVAGKYTSSADISLHNDKVVYLRTTRTCQPRFLQRFVIENFKRPHTHVAVLSSDCIVDKNYLTNLNTYFNQGYQAVASRLLHPDRKSISNRLQSSICSYHNFFSGSLMFLSGSSATLFCPGMSFTVWCYKQCLKTNNGNTGFVARLQAKMVQRGQRIAFASGAVVYKQSSAHIRQLAQRHAQRVFDWLMHFVFSCKTIIKGVRYRNADRFLSGISLLRMPVPTGMIIGFACLAVNIRIHPAMAVLWTGILLLIPLYMMIADARSRAYSYRSETEIQDEENIFESIALFEPDESYDAMMQTV